MFWRVARGRDGLLLRGGGNPREVTENTADRVKNMQLSVICKDTKHSEMGLDWNEKRRSDV